MLLSSRSIAGDGGALARPAGTEWLRASAAAGAVGVICVLLGATGLMIWRHHGAEAERQRSAEFTAAARQGVVALTSMDFQSADVDVQRVLDNSAGEFRDDFQAKAADFTETVKRSKVVTKGIVNAAAVESMTPNAAVVLVAATSEVTNSAGARQAPRLWRLSVAMSKYDGQPEDVESRVRAVTTVLGPPSAERRCPGIGRRRSCRARSERVQSAPGWSRRCWCAP